MPAFERANNGNAFSNIVIIPAFVVNAGELLIVKPSNDDAQNVTGVTYGGQALTLLGSTPHASAREAGIYYGENLGDGTGQDVVVNYSGNTRGLVVCEAYSDAGVPDNYIGATITTADPAITVLNVTSSDLVTDHWTDQSSSGTPIMGANQTLTDAAANFGRRAEGSWQDGANGGVMSRTHGARTVTLVGCRIPPSGAAPIQGDPEDLSQAQTLGEPSGQRNTSADPQDLSQAQSLSEPTGQRNTSADPLDLSQAQSVSEPTGSSTGPTTGDPEDLGQLQAISEPSGQRNTSASPESLTQAQSVSEPTGTTAILGDVESLSQAQSLETPAGTVTRVATPENLVQLQSLTEPGSNRQTTATVESLNQGQTLGEPFAMLPVTGRRFPMNVQDMQRQVVKKLGEPMTTPGGVFDGIFENEWYDPALGPIGFEGAQTYVEFMGADIELIRGDQVTRQLDGQVYTVKEVRREEFAFIRYILEAA